MPVGYGFSTHSRPFLTRLIIGLGLTLMSTRVLESLLYGVGPRDPLVLSVSMVVLAGVAALASWIPARRASRIDPIEALRME